MKIARKCCKFVIFSNIQWKPHLKPGQILRQTQSSFQSDLFVGIRLVSSAVFFMSTVPHNIPYSVLSCNDTSSMAVKLIVNLFLIVEFSILPDFNIKILFYVFRNTYNLHNTFLSQGVFILFFYPSNT